jgi:tRNA (adenine37-N6)-methyltransferase
MQAIAMVGIGIVRSPWTALAGMPIQPVFAEEARGAVEVFSQFADGLRDLEGFNRLWLVCWLHAAPPGPLRLIPFRDTAERGVFSTRAPCRPNAIGLSCVRLLGVSGNVLSIGGVDILDGTPLLDIKPYVPEFDSFPGAKAGWLDKRRVELTHADARFEPRRKE